MSKDPQTQTQTPSPWLTGLTYWTDQAERMQQTAIDGLQTALDHGHQLAKESLELSGRVGGTVQQMVSRQVERATSLVESLVDPR